MTSALTQAHNLLALRLQPWCVEVNLELPTAVTLPAATSSDLRSRCSLVRVVCRY